MTEQELTVEQIDALLADLKAKKKALRKRTRMFRPKSVIVCSLCGLKGTSDTMHRVSKSEYSHIQCPTKKEVTYVQAPKAEYELRAMKIGEVMSYTTDNATLFMSKMFGLIAKGYVVSTWRADIQ